MRFFLDKVIKKYNVYLILAEYNRSLEIKLIKFYEVLYCIVRSLSVRRLNPSLNRKKIITFLSLR